MTLKPNSLLKLKSGFLLVVRDITVYDMWQILNCEIYGTSAKKTFLGLGIFWFDTDTEIKDSYKSVTRKDGDIKVHEIERIIP